MKKQARRGRPFLPKNERKTYQIATNVTQAEYLCHVAEARNMKMTISQYVRYWISFSGALSGGER